MQEKYIENISKTYKIELPKRSIPASVLGLDTDTAMSLFFDNYNYEDLKEHIQKLIS